MRQRRQGEQRRQQRHGVRLGEAICRQQALQLRKLLLRCVVPVPVQQPLQMHEHRVQGTLLGIGRAAEGDPRHPVAPRPLAHLLHQAGFADARFTTEQHHLSVPVSGLLPASPEQSEFLLPPHQGR